MAKICNRINISSYDVHVTYEMEFLNFEPGLVGGHCIGVDPYYLAEKAMKLKLSQVILSGRNTNDNMVSFIVNEIIKELVQDQSVYFLA